MIQETIITLRNQTPTAPNEWLYQSTFETKEKQIVLEDGTTESTIEEVETRNFVKSIYLGVTAEPWAECTGAEKLAWEEANKPEEQVTE